MDEDSDEVMAPMVDALTGAMSAILLVSIFMMLNSMMVVSEVLKNKGKEALYQSEKKLANVFKLEAPIFDENKNILYFFKSFSLTGEQKKKLTTLFSEKPIKKLTVYSNESTELITFNTLSFLNDVGLSEDIENFTIDFLPTKEITTEFIWEFR